MIYLFDQGQIKYHVVVVVVSVYFQRNGNQRYIDEISIIQKHQRDRCTIHRLSFSVTVTKMNRVKIRRKSKLKQLQRLFRVVCSVHVVESASHEGKERVAEDIGPEGINTIFFTVRQPYWNEVVQKMLIIFLDFMPQFAT